MDNNLITSNHAHSEGGALYEFENNKETGKKNYLTYLDAITTTIDLENFFSLYSYITS